MCDDDGRKLLGTTAQVGDEDRFNLRLHDRDTRLVIARDEARNVSRALYESGRQGVAKSVRAEFTVMKLE